MALGGDEDVPHRERQSEKDARAQHEAQTGRDAWSGGDDLDDAHPARKALPSRQEWGLRGCRWVVLACPEAEREQEESKKIMAYETAG